jgi:hypothetical protein
VLSGRKEIFMRYGLPGIVGITRRAYRTVSKKNRGELREDINWLWGWVGIAGLWFIGHVVLAISNLF